MESELVSLSGLTSFKLSQNKTNKNIEFYLEPIYNKNMGYNLFLDDQIDDMGDDGLAIRRPDKFDKTGREYVCLKTVQQAIDYIEGHGCPDHISFDFDLGPNEKGELQQSSDLVKWMIERDLDNPGFIPDHFTYFVHSANVMAPAALDKLGQYLKLRRG